MQAKQVVMSLLYPSLLRAVPVKCVCTSFYYPLTVVVASGVTGAESTSRLL